MITVKKFSASWCNPCKSLQPIIEDVKSQVSGVSFQDIDVDDQTAIAQQYQVRSVPTVVIESNGKEVERIIGVQPKSTYIKYINEWK